MRIGVVADTHAQTLPKQMLEDFAKVDLIIHAGDFCSMDDVKALRAIKELKGVYGNMDSDDVRDAFPRQQIIKCGKFNIGLFHGEGSPKNLIERIKREFKNKDVDVIIFGHSHQPMNEVIDRTLYFNPGSPTDTIFAPYLSYGILELNEQISGQIIKVKNP